MRAMARDEADPTAGERGDPTIINSGPVVKNMAGVREAAPAPQRAAAAPPVDADEHVERDFSAPPARAGGKPWLAWLITAAAVGGAGWAWWSLYRPLSDEATRLQDELTSGISEQTKQKDRIAELEAKVTELESAQSQLAQTVEEKDKAQAEIKRGDVLLKQVRGDLVMDLADKIMFDSGAAELNESGKEVFKRVAQTLIDTGKLIQIGGHTDDLPISDKLKTQFPSNWELSTARATNVVRFLQNDCKIPGKRLAAAGFAEYRPTASNKSSTGRRKNRRIEVILLERK
jgi:chemotaxis protein MotB